MVPPPFRADQVGSLIRPDYLIAARRASGLSFDTGLSRNTDSTSQSLKDAEQGAIAEVIAEQLKRGIEPLSSGEFERSSFFDGFFGAFEGVGLKHLEYDKFRTGLPLNLAFQKLAPSLTGRDVAVATAKIKHVRSPYLNDWLYTRSLLPEERWKDVKITIPSPSFWHHQIKDESLFSPGVYSSSEEYLKDMAEAAKAEILTLYDAGVRFIQVDDPNLTFYCDQAYVETQAQEGVDVDEVLNQEIECHNMMLTELPHDLRIGVHLCRGNFPDELAVSSGGYDRIAIKLFQELNYDLFYLEYDTDRAGDFTPLQKLPRNKAAVLGIVSTRTSKMEDLDVLKARVLQAADLIAEGQGITRDEALKNNLAVSPQCGFASADEAKGVGMSQEVQWQKLELLKRLAADVWPSKAH